MNHVKIAPLRDVGVQCKEFRKQQGYYQSAVAKDLGYSTENISAFETGRNDNARILLWYLAHGFNANNLYWEE